MVLYARHSWKALSLAAALATFNAVFPAAADTLTIAQGNDILSLDPANHGNNSTESALVNIYDYLVNKDFSQGQLRFTPRRNPAPASTAKAASGCCSTRPARRTTRCGISPRSPSPRMGTASSSARPRLSPTISRPGSNRARPTAST
jgi:hypothetical protein